MLDSARGHFAARGMEISAAFCDKLAADVHATADDLSLSEHMCDSGFDTILDFSFDKFTIT